MDDMVFKKQETQKELQEEENEVYKYFQKRIKCWGYFAILFSSYTLLNVFIEFSSAPFYELKFDCFVLYER